ALPTCAAAGMRPVSLSTGGLGFGTGGGVNGAAGGTSFSVAVLSPRLAASSVSRRLETVAVASSSPACPTVPQIITVVPIPGEIHATSQTSDGAVPVQPGPRSA